MQQALNPSTPLQENLRVLTDEIGGRVPGTPAMQKAIQWGVDAFKAAGADSVHTEEFTIPTSWAEGNTEVDVVAPVKFHVLAHSIAWGPPLKPTTARVVDVGMGTAAEFAKAGDMAGAIVLVHSVVLKTWDDLFDEYFRAPGIIAQAVKGKALAIAFTSSREHDILYRHINTAWRQDRCDSASAAGARRFRADCAPAGAWREGPDVAVDAKQDWPDNHYQQRGR